MIIDEDLERDIKCAISQLENHNSHRYSIYPWSNEHIENYYNYYDLQGKKVLCPTGSGDHALHAITGGASKIDCVDILEPNGVIYDAICRRNFENAKEFNNLEKKIPTKFYNDSISVEKGVYVYRKK